MAGRAPFEFDFKAARSVPDLRTLDWATVHGVHWVEGGLGSTGVFFVQLAAGVVVVKPSCAAMFAGRLARLHGLRTPAMRSLGLEEEATARAALSIARFTNPPDSLRLKNQRVAALTVMEFVPGTPLYARADALAGPGAPAFLEDLGKLVALDMLTNNFDRVPLVWNNTGNLENVMVEEHAGADGSVVLLPVAIDSGVNPILNADGFARYKAQVTEALAEVDRADATGPRISKVRAQIKELTGADIGEGGCLALLRGVKAGLATLAALHAKQPDFIDRELEAALAEMQLQAHNAFFGEALKRLNADFLRSMVQVLTKV